jgi:hypothetical protein
METEPRFFDPQMTSPLGQNLSIEAITAHLLLYSITLLTRSNIACLLRFLKKSCTLLFREGQPGAFLAENGPGEPYRTLELDS